MKNTHYRIGVKAVPRGTRGESATPAAVQRFAIGKALASGFSGLSCVHVRKTNKPADDHYFNITLLLLYRVRRKI